MTNISTFATVFVVTITVLSMVGMGAGIATPATAQTIDSAERTMDTDAERGDTLEIQVEVVVSEGGTDDLTIEEQFDPNVEETGIGEVTVNGESRTADIQEGGKGGIFVWFEDEEFADGDTIVLAYEITIPDDAGGQEFEIDGYAIFGEEVTTSGPDTITVQGDGAGSDGDDENAGGDTDEENADGTDADDEDAGGGTDSDGNDQEVDDGETDADAGDETADEADGEQTVDEEADDEQESGDTQDADETDSEANAGDEAVDDEGADTDEDAVEPSDDDDSGSSWLLYALLGGGLLAVLLGGGYAYTRRDRTRDPQSPF